MVNIDNILQQALIKGSKKEAQHCLELGADPNRLIADNRSSFHIALKKGLTEERIKWFDLLLRYCPIEWELLIANNCELLMQIARLGDKRFFEKQLSREPNEVLKAIKTPVKQRLLLAAKYFQKLTELQKALIEQNEGNVQNLLLSYSVDPNEFDHDTKAPLQIALEVGKRAEKIGYVSKLLKCGADPNCYNRKHNSPLQVAASLGDLDLCRVLLKGGVNLGHEMSTGINLTTDAFQTPLQYAANRGCTEVVKLLLEHGASPNQLNYYDTPIQKAIRGNHLKTVEILIQYGADLTMKTICPTKKLHSLTALEIAYNQSNPLLIELLENNLSCESKLNEVTLRM